MLDDSILDKNHSHGIELVRRQCSGKTHSLAKGIGMGNCLHVKPETSQYWIVGYRVFDRDGDCKTWLDHVCEMMAAAIANKNLVFTCVLFDRSYASKDLMLQVESLNMVYYYSSKSNRHVADSDTQLRYKRVDALQLSQA